MQRDYSSQLAFFQTCKLSVYDIRRNWSKRFKPLIPAVEPTLQRAIRCYRSDFDPNKHIPREAGWCLDAPRPRTRTCARAFHMYGCCHIIAVVMLDFAQRALPNHEWWLVNGLERPMTWTSSSSKR